MSQHDAPTVLRVFMFTDIVGSTNLKRRLGDAEGSKVIARHDGLFRECLARFGGREESNPGDGFFATFDVPSDAVRCALAFQKELGDLATPEPLKVRVGIHMGETARVVGETTKSEHNKLLGLAVDLTARVMDVAQGGQILLTRAAFDSVRQQVLSAPDASPVEWRAHGPYLFKGIDDPVVVCEVGIAGLSPLAPPPDSGKAKRVLAPGEEEALGWRPAAGLPVPGRTAWKLERSVGAGEFGEVWLARHQTTHDVRAFKFCCEVNRLRALKRELTLLRLIKDSLGQRRDIARLYEVRLDKPPFYLEMEYTNGGDLTNWADAQDGIASVPLEIRLELIAQVADALAAAHSAGIIHKDVSPSNVLIQVSKKGGPEVRLTDFGIGQIVSTAMLKEADITVTGFGGGQTTMTNLNGHTGTRLYMAPELFQGKPPTARSDLYALGVLLFQVVVGDLERPLVEGWSAQVKDQLLREDIAGCVATVAADRFGDAGELARRLRSLEERRQQHGEEKVRIGIEYDQTIGLTRSSADGSTTEVRVPRQLGSTRLIREIGRGGMGVVYLGRDQMLERDVAVKFLLNVVSGTDDPGFKRFLEGARAATAVRHPGLNTIHQADIIDGVPYLVMEYIDGAALSTVVKRTGPLSLAATVAVLDAATHAIGALHDRGIIHRDVKPANILLDADGDVFVTDFGLSCPRPSMLDRESFPGSTSTVAGTLAYMAPEMFKGAVSQRSDVYALGITAYQLLTGTLPFTGSPHEVRNHHYDDPLPPEPLDEHRINPRIREVLDRATHKNIMFRYKSAHYFRQALTGAAGSDALATGVTELPSLVAQSRKDSTVASPLVGDEPGHQPGSSSSSTYFDRLATLADTKRLRRPAPAKTPKQVPLATPTPLPVERSVAPGATLAADVPCAQCAYNLRTLSRDAPCPECGTSVSASLRPDRLLFAEKQWLSKVIRGHNFVVVGVACALVFTFTWPVIRALLALSFTNLLTSLPKAAVILASGTLAITVIAATGLFFATTRDPGKFVTRRADASRWITRVAMTLALVGCVGLFIPLPLPRVRVLMLITQGMLPVALAISAMAYLFYLATLADRIPNAKIALSSRQVAWFLAILVVVTGVWAALHEYTETIWWVLRSHIALSVVIAGCLVAFLGIAFLVFSYARQFKRVIADHIPCDLLFVTPDAVSAQEGVDNEQISEAAPDGTLQIDLTCLKCGYILRGLLPDQNCPECNEAISVSLNSDRLIFADRRRLLRLSRGLGVFLWIIIGVVAWGLFMEILGKYWLVRFSIVPIAAWKMILLSLSYGVWLATTRGAARALADDSRNSCRMARILAVLCALAAVVPTGGTFIEVILSLQMMLAASAILSVLWWLGAVARGLPDPRLVLWARILGITSASLPVILLALTLAYTLAVNTRWSATVLATLPLLWFATSVALVPLVVKYRRALRSVIAANTSYEAVKR
ncbi:MAG: protein kinase [Phycisphaerae bacterium]